MTSGIQRLLRETARVTKLSALMSTWQGRFIAVFVIAQLLLPLHYYLARKDPHDERFAWRMFSPMRMARCVPSVAIDIAVGDPVFVFVIVRSRVVPEGAFDPSMIT